MPRQLLLLWQRGLREQGFSLDSSAPPWLFVVILPLHFESSGEQERVQTSGLPSKARCRKIATSKHEKTLGQREHQHKI